MRGPLEAMTKATYRGLVLVPTTHGMPVGPLGPGQWFAWCNDLECFWQYVFFSFVAEESPALCEKCGAFLGFRTPKGRPMKRRFCDRCRWSDWWANQKKERKRAKWRVDEIMKKKKRNKSQDKSKE